MTDHARAIEAGARAIKTMRKARVASLPFAPYGSPSPLQDKDYAAAAIEGAIASGALVPASATKPYSSAEFLTSPEALGEYVKEVVAEMRERCLSIIRKHTIGNGDEYDQQDIGAVVCAKQIEREILDAASASGEYVVAPRVPTDAMIRAGDEAGGGAGKRFCTPVTDDIWTAMLHAASRTGGGK